MHKLPRSTRALPAAYRPSMLELRVRDGGFVAYASHDDTDGVPFAIKGVTWGGAEGGEEAAEGCSLAHGFAEVAQ